ncbi:hypothetical protein MC7420_6423 [Coleofasciculus chthonoplastes PCC 7420]|uniref:Uncharacterized protein n=1 Tax=Coleofasciculus chthonoplastes PCC 7420 TaxID=118168 RepID=B4VQB0_9CYAN|nr:hypothetical protein MC7420_6423 [Coleofasciculus chthonoplastes PCC 7420]
MCSPSHIMFREFVRHIETVSVEQVNQVAKELLHPDNLVIVTM